MVEITSSEKGAVIRVKDRFDFKVSKQFLTAVTEATDQTGTTVTVDLRNVSYMDSSALGMLLILRDKAKTAGKRVALANANQQVASVLQIANFGALFQIDN